MKKLKNITFTNKEWNHIKYLYKRFYKNNNKCSKKCPIGKAPNRNDKIFQSKIHEDFKLKYCDFSSASGKCMCHEFEEFNNPNCPCNTYGEKAFLRLEKLIKRIDEI